LGICLADNPNVLTDLERCREANRDAARCPKSPKPISSSLCPCEGAQASRKSLAELVDANDRAFRDSRRQRAAWVSSHAPECTELPVEGDRGFEILSPPPASLPRIASRREPQGRKAGAFMGAGCQFGRKRVRPKWRTSSPSPGEAQIATPWIRRCGDNPSSCAQILCQSSHRPPDCDLAGLVADHVRMKRHCRRDGRSR
jgi:hypothetical protein